MKQTHGENRDFKSGHRTTGRFQVVVLMSHINCDDVHADASQNQMVNTVSHSEG